MRPNPLMPIRTVMNYSRPNSVLSRYMGAWSHLPKLGKCCTGDRLCGNSKLFIQFLVRRACAERVHAYKDAISSNDNVPALPHGCFDADIEAGRADDGASVLVALLQEKLEAGDRDHPRSDAALG